MKKNALLSLVSLAVLATCASAAPQPEAAVFFLPTYVVSAPLHQPAEQKVNASLYELRQQVRIPLPIAIELPLVKSAPVRANLTKMPVPEGKVIQVAKL